MENFSVYLLPGILHHIWSSSIGSQVGAVVSVRASVLNTRLQLRPCFTVNVSWTTFHQHRGRKLWLESGWTSPLIPLAPPPQDKRAILLSVPTCWPYLSGLLSRWAECDGRRCRSSTFTLGLAEKNKQKTRLPGDTTGSADITQPVCVSLTCPSVYMSVCL